MKKIFLLLVAITILAAVAAPAFAQGRSRRTYCAPVQTSRVYRDNSRVYSDNSRVYSDNSRVYSDNSRAYYDYGYRDRSVWDRHRDKLTLVMGTAGGAAIGGLIGGQRGAIIGAASGLGASALYTYKIRNRRLRY